jgi:hypothetical protein
LAILNLGNILELRGEPLNPAQRNTIGKILLCTIKALIVTNSRVITECLSFTGGKYRHPSPVTLTCARKYAVDDIVGGLSTHYFKDNGAS